MKFLFTFLFFFTIQFTAIAQVPISPAQAQAELDKRGITEAEIRQKLLEKGIDIDKIDPSDPAQVTKLQQATEEAIAELEQEKAQNSGSTSTSPETPKESVEERIEKIEKEENATLDQQDIENVTEAIEEGASVEEAVSEELSEQTQEKLPPVTIYGQQIFRNQSLKLFSTVKDVKPPDSYILGVGDEIGISIFGVSQGDFTLTIDEDGYIKPSGLPRILLKGITYGKAKQLLQSRFRQYYIFSNGQFAVTINAARTISVNIFGEVNKYGSFTISAINTAINALVAGGGPSNIGTLRNIQLIRNGKTKRIDVYEFMQNPSKQYDYFLENNDIIHVPIQERVVAIQGAVKRPMKYELIEGENLIQLIEYAGGLTDNAYRGLVQIKRFINNEEIILDVDLRNLQASNSDYTLLSGDVISLKNIAKPYQNYVEISGAVDLPGKYQLENNMKVSELLEKGELKEEARTDIAFLLRTNPDKTVEFLKLNLDNIRSNPSGSDNIVLQPKDNLSIYTLERYTDKATISINGAVRNPTEYPFPADESIRVQDAILLAGGLEQEAAAYGYIKRTDLTDPKFKNYIRVNLFEALNDSNSSENQVLKPDDVITVYTKGRFTDAATVSISGAVRDANAYDFDEGLRISDLVYFSGGLSQDATDLAYLIRTDTSNNLLKEYVRIDLKAALKDSLSSSNRFLQAFDEIRILSKSTFTDLSTVRVSGAVRSPGEFQFDESLTLQDALTLAGGLKLEAASNRIDIFRVELNENQPTKTEFTTVQVDKNLALRSQNFILQPFDQIVVRAIPDFEFQKSVTIEGEVKYPGTYALAGDNEKLLSLIQRAGGLTNEAFPEGTTLLRKENDLGFVVTDINKILNNQNSKFNYLLKEGDIISIPKNRDLVTINLSNTDANELYADRILQGGKVNVAYSKGKNAKWYVRKYAAGLSENASRKKVSVEYANGRLKQTRDFGLFKIYPKAKKGAVISIGSKPEKEKKEKKEREPVDWEKIIANSLAQVSAVLTLILLVQRI